MTHLDRYCIQNITKLKYLDGRDMAIYFNGNSWYFNTSYAMNVNSRLDYELWLRIAITRTQDVVLPAATDIQSDQDTTSP